MDSVKGGGLNKQGDVSLVRSANADLGANGVSNVPAMQEVSGIDRKCEEGVG